MNIVLPIVFLAAGIGLFAKRVTSAHWIALGSVITLIVAYHFFKHTA